MNDIQKDILDKLDEVAEKVRKVDEDKLDSKGYEVFSLLSELSWFSQHLQIGEDKDATKETTK